MQEFNKEYDIYNEEFLEDSVEEDEISDLEEGFMKGYLGA